MSTFPSYGSRENLFMNHQDVSVNTTQSPSVNIMEGTATSKATVELTRARIFTNLESHLEWDPLKAIWKSLRNPIKQKVRDQTCSQIHQTLMEYNQS